MKKRTNLVVAVLLVLAMCFAGCGKVTLESFYNMSKNKAELNKQIETMKEEYSDFYSDFTIEVKGNAITYGYYYAEGIEMSAEDLKTMDFKTLADETKDAIEDEVKIRPESITYNYYLSDGTFVYGETN